MGVIKGDMTQSLCSANRGGSSCAEEVERKSIRSIFTQTREKSNMT